MGLYIPEAQIDPTHHVWIIVHPDGTVEYDGWAEWKTLKQKAVPVPEPHGRLGDLDRMLTDNEIYYNQLGRADGAVGARYRSVKRSIELAPTIIPAEEGTNE